MSINPTAPILVTQPQSQSIDSGNTVTLSVVAHGYPSLHYQWYRNGMEISGAVFDSFSFTAARETIGKYFVIVSNSEGSVVSDTAEVSIPPKIISSSHDQIVKTGDTVVFAVTASSCFGQLSYQWQKNGVDIPDAVSAVYHIGSTQTADTGIYKVIIHDSLSTIESIPARLRIRGSTLSVEKVSAGYYHSLILRTDGILWACGDNGYGQLGDGSGNNHYVPVPIMSNVKDIATGAYHSLILKTDGTLWACGYNGYGQLGDSTTDNTRRVPVQVMRGVQGIAAGDFHSLILKTDGTLWVCGNNDYGQLGDSSTVSRFVPVPIMINVKDMRGGGRYTLILRTDGTLWACGNNEFGKLGDGTYDNHSVPFQIMSQVHTMSAGSIFTLFLKTDATLWACGANWTGQYGNGTDLSESTPTQIATGIKVISAGNDHSFIVKTDESLWSCGSNNYGQLGDGTTTTQYSPIQIMNDAQDISLGDLHTMIIKTDGTLWSCGNNDQGQLGDGTTTTQLTPVQISLPEVPISIQTQPEPQSTDFGQYASFSVEAYGMSELKYQWRLNGVDIPGATSSFYWISSVTMADAGTYTVRVYNDDAGEVVSDPAELTVNTIVQNQAGN